MGGLIIAAKMPKDQAVETFSGVGEKVGAAGSGGGYPHQLSSGQQRLTHRDCTSDRYPT